MVPLKTLATLAVDGNVIASSHKLTHADPNVPLLSVTNVSGTIQSLEVFVIGITSVKVAISVNDDFVYKDKIGLLDKLQLKLYGGKGI